MSETHSLTQHSAGGIVYRNHSGRIEVAMIKDSYGKWTFPKGHVEPNETIEETAKREISEEIGIPEINLQLRLELGEMNYWFNSTFASDIAASHAKSTEGPTPKSVKIHKYVTYFLFETDAETELLPQVGEVDATEWVSLSEIDDRNEYEDNRDLIKRAKNYFTEKGLT